MKAIFPSGLSRGGAEEDVRFALSIARQSGRAQFARRPSRRNSDDDEQDEREERPRYSGSQVSTSWLIAGFVAAVGIVIVLIVWNQGSKENLKSFQELQDLISIPQGAQRVFPPMSQADFIKRTGEPIRGRDYDDGNCVYMYFKVREGVVEIALDKPSWKRNIARIARVILEQ